MSKSSTTSEKVISFLLCIHNPGVIVAGSYPNGHICFLSDICEMVSA